MMKIGLMGCGVVATYGHLPAIKATSGLQLAAVYDPDAQRAEATRAAFSAGAAFSDVESFLSSGLDGVTITSPAPAHLGNALDAARHGLPVLCEKPLAMDDAEAQTMIQTFQEAGLPLFTGYCYRFAGVAGTIKQLVDQGAIGEVKVARLPYLWSLHGKWDEEKGAPHLAPRRHGRMLEGGPMVDCGVHQIDLARWWLGGEITSWHAEGQWFDGYEAPDHMWLHLKHAGGAHTVVEISYAYGHTARCAPPHFLYELIGTEGVLRFDRASHRLEMHTPEGTTVFEAGHEKDFAGMYAAYAHALATGEATNLPTGEDGLIATRIARQATEQLQRSRSHN